MIELYNPHASPENGDLLAKDGDGNEWLGIPMKEDMPEDDCFRCCECSGPVQGGGWLSLTIFIKPAVADLPPELQEEAANNPEELHEIKFPKAVCKEHVQVNRESE